MPRSRFDLVAASLRFTHCMGAGGPKKNMGRLSLTAAAVASADDGGVGKLKSSWAEMVGKEMVEAVAIIIYVAEAGRHLQAPPRRRPPAAGLRRPPRLPLPRRKPDHLQDPRRRLAS